MKPEPIKVPVKIYFNHDLAPDVPVLDRIHTFTDDAGEFHFEGRLVSEEIVAYMNEFFVRPSFVGMRQRSWKEREAEAVKQGALRRRIPRVLRTKRDNLRCRLAHAIYPFEEDEA